MKVVFLTAGAAGMYCGSCMHDNALARGLRAIGVDCLLQPTYTPLRTDEPNVSRERVFFGGIQIYLLQTWPWLRFVPPRMRSWLDWPPLLRLATRRAAATDAAMLGNLAVSMLRGTHGNQRDEVLRLADWLSDVVQPDAIVLSNLLIGGSLPTLRERFPHTCIAVMLQGDDIFLDHLPERQRAEAISLCRGLQQYVDVFLTNSEFYARKMGAMLGIDSQRIRVMPLSIDVTPFASPAGVSDSDEKTVQSAGSSRPFRLGYLARIAPEKGLHRLVDAFLQLATRSENQDLRLDVAGWLGEANRPYLDSLRQRIAEAGLEDRFQYWGSPDLLGKIAFLRQLDLMCVPTEYEEPKGLFVLESLAAGVCVAQPRHGAFGELLQQTGGGMTFDPLDLGDMCRVLQTLKDDTELRRRLASEGQARVRTHHSIEVAARTLAQLLDPSHRRPTETAEHRGLSPPPGRSLGARTTD